MSRKSAVTLAMMVCLLGATLAASAAPQSVVLELKGEPGQEMKWDVGVLFEMSMTAKNPATGEQMFSLDPRFSGALVAIDRVTAVADNGDLTLQSQLESFEMTLDVADLHMDLSLQGPGGGPPELIKLPPLPIEIVMSKRGKLLALKGLDKLPLPPIPGPTGERLDLQAMVQNMMETLSQPTFPEGPVSVGDSWVWEAEIDLAEMMGKMVPDLPDEAKMMLSSMKIPVRCTSVLEGFETEGGVECAKVVADVTWELELPLGPGVMLKEGAETRVMTWFDHEAGRAVKELVEAEVHMRAGPPEAALAQMEMAIRAESKLR